MSTTRPIAASARFNTYAGLVAERDAGTLSNLDYLRAMRAAGLVQVTRVASAARRQASAARRVNDAATRSIRYNARFTDEALTADLNGSDVQARYARILLRLSTVADRQQAQADSHYISNVTGARPSDALDSAVQSILAGRPIRRVA